MLRKWFRLLRGYLKIRVVGYSPERFINLCKNKKIALWGLEAGQEGYEMYITVSGFRKLKPILKKSRTKVRILKRYGFPFFMFRFRKRNLFFGGIVLCLLLIYILSFFIWDIRTEGNSRITDETLLEFLGSTGVSAGMRRRKVDCEQIVRDVRKEFDDIIWVSAYTEGARLFIHVKENEHGRTVLGEPEKYPADIVADKSGKVISIITRTGVPKVEQGDEVEEGDVLVSGTVEVYNDAKEVVGYRYVKADADIVLERQMLYEDGITKYYEKKEYTGKKRFYILCKYKNIRLHLGWETHNFEDWEMHGTERQLCLKKNFPLPVTLGNCMVREYVTRRSEYTEKEMQKLLKNRFDYFCKKLEREGTSIKSRKLEFKKGKDYMTAQSLMMLEETMMFKEPMMLEETVDF